MAEAELLELFEKASKAASKVCNKIEDGESNAVVDAGEEARCTEALKALGAVEISTSLLMSTKVGKRLRKLTKHSSMKISKSAQEILQDWKKVVSAEFCSNSNKTSKKLHFDSDSVSPPPESDVSAITHAATVQPKRIKVTQIKVVRVTKTLRNSVPKAGMENHVNSSAPVPVSSSSAMDSAQQIGAIQKSGDDARDRIRELMVEALAKVCKEATDDDLEKAKKINVVEVAVAVENALFAKLGLSRGTEKAKYRSIMFNIKDDKNPDFRRRVLLGRIKPEAIVTMTSNDMASDHRKKETENIKAKAMFDCERGVQGVASTEQFKCAKCKQRKTTYHQMQTRSADEPMTTFVTCLNCNAHWKF